MGKQAALKIPEDVAKLLVAHKLDPKDSVLANLIASLGVKGVAVLTFSPLPHLLLHPRHTLWNCPYTNILTYRSVRITSDALLQQ